MRFASLTLAAQTAYAELVGQTQTFEMTNALSGLVGAFHRRSIKRSKYWYFAYRDIDQKLRMAYVGPDNERVRALVERFEEIRKDKPLAPAARMAITAGCAPAAPNLTVSLPASTSTAARTAMKPAGDCFGDKEAQGWNRVGHMPLCPPGGRAGRNPGVRKAFVVERGFFWSRHG